MSSRDASAVAKSVLVQSLAALASLRLTVLLFALSIFLVLAGTLAQVEKDIWQVVAEYFRTPVAWIDFQLFFPPSFFPSRPKIPGGFYFPGGWLIGAVMFANLAAAHAIRFKTQAKGPALWLGLAVLALGGVLTWLVVISGDQQEAISQNAAIPYDLLWLLFKGTVVLSWLASVLALFKVSKQQTVLWGILLATAISLGIGVGWLLIPANAATPSDSSMRILWQLTKGGAAGIALLIGCLLVFKKRAGIVLLHAGIGLLMSSEVLVGLGAVESQIRLKEGETANFADDIRTVQLAIVTPKDDRQNDVWTISKERLLGLPTGLAQYVPRFSSKNPEFPLIADSRLPFKVKVVDYLQNAALRKASVANKPNPATAGLGLEWLAEERRASTGTDSDSSVDTSAAYVELIGNDGQSLGTRLLSIELSAADIPEKVNVAGKDYDLYLRFKRYYKDYAVTLNDVKKEDYIGTSTPRNYESMVHIYDESRNVDREARIWMNNPIRFAGETFYQSGYFKDEQTQTEMTTLSVVTNSGWMIPYVSCMIVAIGMLAQFLVTLTRFLGRVDGTSRAAVPVPKSSTGPVETDSTATRPLGVWGWAVPVVIVTLIAGYSASKLKPPSPPKSGFDFYAFGQLPIVAGGRVQPLDSLARNSLLALSSKSDFVDADGKTQPAIKWLLDLIADRKLAFDHRVFRIENLEVLTTIGLERRERFRYALSEFMDKFPEIQKQADLARKAEPANRSIYQKKLLELETKIGVMDTLIQSFAPPQLRPDHLEEDLPLAVQRHQALEKRRPGPPLVIPPLKEDGSWQTFAAGWTRDLVTTTYLNQPGNPRVENFTQILLAYSNHDAEKFNKEVAAYRGSLATDAKHVQTGKPAFEAYFNHAQFFTLACVIYVIAFVFAAASWLGWTRTLSRTSFWLIVLALLVHTFALGARIYISGRPPVTNLYSSAVFIGWGTVGLGLMLELIYRLGIGNIVATVSGFATLLIAQYLGSEDTFEVLQAVLDTQFWLATHVTCITFGYATTYVAGLLGLMYVLLGLFTTKLTPQLAKELTRMTYGTLCFSIFFSFVGTVLGGLWADDSWGRFWGWDPKENGALIIVLWNALCLHARWGAMVKDRGLALLAIGGNIAVSWSWFGVNELGVGLHSYGFREGMIEGLGILAVTHLFVIALGLIPQTLWLSMRARAATTA